MWIRLYSREYSAVPSGSETNSHFLETARVGISAFSCGSKMNKFLSVDMI
jgi:hypothetical protein